MAESAYVSGLAMRETTVSNSSRHSVVVRITHWMTALSFIGLVVSGVAILLAHPRLYWGETGAVGTPSLLDLPLPFMLTGQSGWGRYLHFLSAWVTVLTGTLYVTFGFSTQHFRKNLLPLKSDLRFAAIRRVISNHLRFNTRELDSYNVLQRLAYLSVIFILFPLMIWTGLAMSPAITSVLPVLVNVLGGQQSARTIHFFAANLLVLFFFVHVLMVCTSGFGYRMRAVTIGAIKGEPL
jgi:thiosulfate reductase cytochrome b subunit